MKIKRICASTLLLAMLATIGVSAASAGASTAAGGAPSAASGQSDPRGAHGFHRGGDRGALRALSQMTGISENDLLAKYPQKTAWQIAKQLGKLDDLKKNFLSAQKSALDKLVAAGRMTADVEQKIYADLQKRVAAIDGTNTVTLGRPGYRPQKSGK